MSWPNWTGQPISQANVPAVANPAVLPGVQYNPEQWAQLQQQNWQQWAQWQQQYQQWQQQYGAEVKYVYCNVLRFLSNLIVFSIVPKVYKCFSHHQSSKCCCSTTITSN